MHMAEHQRENQSYRPFRMRSAAAPASHTGGTVWSHGCIHMSTTYTSLQNITMRFASTRFDDEHKAQPHPRPHTHKVPFIEAILPGKTQHLVRRLPPQHKAPCNIHAAIYNAFRSITWQAYTCTLRTWQTQRDTESYSHSNAICNHSFQRQRLWLRTHEQPLVAEHQERTDSTSAAAPAAHTRYLFIAGRSHLTRKNTRFRAPASSQHKPRNIHAAITMRFAPSHGKHASLYSHGNKTWQECRTTLHEPIVMWYKISHRSSWLYRCVM